MNFSWKITGVLRVFGAGGLYRRRGGVEGATIRGAALIPGEDAPWRLSGSPSGSVIDSVKYLRQLIFIQFRGYFLKYFSETEKQQKTGTGTMASC